MHKAKQRFEDLDTRIVLAGMGTPGQAEVFRRRHDLTFTIICDPRKHLYKTYGLLRAGITDIVSPKVVISGLKALSKGHMPGVPVGDVRQLSGVFLVGKDSVLRYAYYSWDIVDYPSTADIIQNGYPI
ncbi:MAG: redoxin domain-containing protein [Nitrospirae bacterium]|nr:redoxin domain-containing protein [Nitrospirota bacterium]